MLRVPVVSILTDMTPRSSRYPSFVEADAVFISGLTGAVAEQQISVSGEPGHRRYSDFSLHRQFDFDEATGQLVIEQAGIVFQGSCLPAGS